MPQKSATDYYNLGIGYIDTAETDKTIYDAPGEALQDLIPLELPSKNLDENPELEKHALSWGYFIGVLPIVLGIIGAVYFRPCSFGLC